MISEVVIVDFDSKIANLRLTRDKKIQELNEKIEKGKIKKQEYINKKVKIDEEIIKWDNKIKIWENEIKELKNSFYKELQANLGLTSDEVDDAIIEKGREKNKIKNEHKYSDVKKLSNEIENVKSNLKEEKEIEDKDEPIEEKGSELFD